MLVKANQVWVSFCHHRDLCDFFFSNEAIRNLYVKLYVNVCVVDLRLRYPASSWFRRRNQLLAGYAYGH